MRFVDTNVLLYSISTAPEEAPKAETARSLLESRDLALSVQVLQEFYVQATRATRRDRIAPDIAAGLVESFQRFPIQVTSPAVMTAAFHSGQRFSISYWDAAIVEAARTLGCEIVLSEDLSDEQDYGGVTVVNPFT